MHVVDLDFVGPSFHSQKSCRPETGESGENDMDWSWQMLSIMLPFLLWRDMTLFHHINADHAVRFKNLSVDHVIQVLEEEPRRPKSSRVWHRDGNEVLHVLNEGLDG